MRAGRIAWPPFLPGGSGSLHVDELPPEPHAAQRQMRVEPDIGFDKLLKSFRCAFQKTWRPFDRKPGPDLDRRGRLGVDDLGLAVDVIDAKLDAMRDALGFDDRHACRIGIAANPA